MSSLRQDVLEENRCLKEENLFLKEENENLQIVVDQFFKNLELESVVTKTNDKDLAESDSAIFINIENLSKNTIKCNFQLENGHDTFQRGLIDFFPNVENCLDRANLGDVEDSFQVSFLRLGDNSWDIEYAELRFTHGAILSCRYQANSSCIVDVDGMYSCYSMCVLQNGIEQ